MSAFLSLYDVYNILIWICVCECCEKCKQYRRIVSLYLLLAQIIRFQVQWMKVVTRYLRFPQVHNNNRLKSYLGSQLLQFRLHLSCARFLEIEI